MNLKDKEEDERAHTNGSFGMMFTKTLENNNRNLERADSVRSDNTNYEVIGYRDGNELH